MLRRTEAHNYFFVCFFMYFPFQKWTVVMLTIISVFFLAGCSKSKDVGIAPTIASCDELVNSMWSFQKNCHTDSDCIQVQDPSTFCYSETIHIHKKDEYDALFKKLDCPIDKFGQNDRWDYCKVDWKSENYCNQSNWMCTPWNKK